MGEDAIHLRGAWHDHAAEWVAWAREPDHDHFFWRLSMPALLELLPAPGRATLDLGCGEGRLARILTERGHSVVGVEGSPALAAAARTASPELEVHVGDAADLPFADAAFDLVVASMTLLNFDDMPGAVREVARVLEPGGRFCMSLVHPWNSLKELPDYFAERAYGETRERGGLAMTFYDTHRPLEAYARALEAAGLAIEAIREPVPDDDHVAAHPSVERWRRTPVFLVMRACRPAAAVSPPAAP
jgi:SAM-dependent methyltransferase